MAKTLYFSNPDTQAVQKIADAIEQPEVIAVDIYNRPHRDIFEQVYPDELGSSATAEYNFAGGSGINIPGWVSLNSTASTGSGSANATSSRIWTAKPVVLDSVPQFSDERAHSPHRQDEIKLNYWKVRFSNTSGEPNYAYLLMSDFPNFSSNPPGWWTDPNP